MASFYLLILACFHVKYYQPWHCWNLLFYMLIDYWDDVLYVRSWMRQILHMFYRYLFFFSPGSEYFIENFGCMWISVEEAKKLTAVYYFISLLWGLFPLLSCWKSSAIGVGLFQHVVMLLKLAMRPDRVMIQYSVYRLAIRVSSSHWQNLVMRCLRVVISFYGHLLVITEIKIMRDSQ